MRRVRSLRAGALVLLGAALAPTLVARTVEVRVGLDPTRLAGTDPEGRVKMYAPDPLEGGSSVSHFDRSAFPDLLMEPSASDDLAFRQIDLTLPLFEDLGWPRGNANIVVHYTDAAGTGFQHPSLGAQRRAAFEAAASAWAGLLGSGVQLNVEAGFDDLPCEDGSATLAQAGAQFVFESFPGAPVGGTWYPGALAEALSGQNLSLEDVADPNAGELVATFNSAIDNGCLGAGATFYYGLDANFPGNRISFVNVALHELAHGLGFASFVDSRNGQQFLGRPDIYSRFLFDRTQGRQWHQMTDSQRAQSAVNTDNLVWSGPRVFSRAPSFLQAAPSLLVTRPASVAGSLDVGTAEFGPALTSAGVTGELVRAVDASGVPLQVCGPVANAAEVAGRIAMIDRGSCNFTVKVKNAQDAGARAVVIVNNEDGGPPQMGGTDASISIPAVSIRRADGQALDAALATPAEPGRLRLESSALTVGEADGPAVFRVVREQGSDDRVTVGWTVAGQTADASDLAVGSGSVAFEDGESGTRAVQVAITNDSLVEAAETALISLSGPTGGATLVSPTSAVLTIVDDDVPTAGQISFTVGSIRFSEGAGVVGLGVRRTGGAEGAVSVSVDVVGGTATAGVDFTVPDRVDFADGQATAQLPLTLLDDEASEADETLILELADPTGEATLGSPVRMTVTVTDDEPCVPSDTVHCLQDARFRVQVDWTDFVGQQGPGRTAPLRSDDSGLFWFFSPDNWELLVKVLRGCPVNDRYWVFAAATTNVGYTLRITDLASGAVQEYTNPVGRQADALTDTGAFATCP